jgi:hypothetical protein
MSAETKRLASVIADWPAAVAGECSMAMPVRALVNADVWAGPMSSASISQMWHFELKNKKESAEPVQIG